VKTYELKKYIKKTKKNAIEKQNQKQKKMQEKKRKQN
jgi:hypothetical protein